MLGRAAARAARCPRAGRDEGDEAGDRGQRLLGAVDDEVDEAVLGRIDRRGAIGDREAGALDEHREVAGAGEQGTDLGRVAEDGSGHRDAVLAADEGVERPELGEPFGAGDLAAPDAAAVGEVHERHALADAPGSSAARAARCRRPRWCRRGRPGCRRRRRRWSRRSWRTHRPGRRRRGSRRRRGPSSRRPRRRGRTCRPPRSCPGRRGRRCAPRTSRPASSAWARRSTSSARASCSSSAAALNDATPETRGGGSVLGGDTVNTCSSWRAVDRSSDGTRRWARRARSATSTSRVDDGAITSSMP